MDKDFPFTREIMFSCEETARKQGDRPYGPFRSEERGGVGQGLGVSGSESLKSCIWVENRVLSSSRKNKESVLGRRESKD